MSIVKNWLGLSPRSEGILAVGLSVFVACVGIRIIKAPNLAVEVAGHKLITSNTASKLDELAEQLEYSAAIIEQKDAAYARLEQIYNSSLRGKKDYNRLQQAIEAVDAIPPIEDIDRIKTEIELTEQSLSDVIGDRLN